MKIYNLLLTVLLSSNVYSGTLEVSWIVPTKRENGIDLSLSEIKKFGIRYKTDGSKSKMRYPKSTLTSDKFTVPDGVYTIDMRAYDTNGLKSKWSEPITKEAK